MIERPVADHLAERSQRSVESALLMGSGAWVKVRWGSREKRGACPQSLGAERRGEWGLEEDGPGREG